jgi:hypothetical protein
VTGVEKREIKIPIEIQKQAVDLDEKCSGGCTGSGAVGPWQRGSWQLNNELGGVKPLAFGQYGELGPGFEGGIISYQVNALRLLRQSR